MYLAIMVLSCSVQVGITKISATGQLKHQEFYFCMVLEAESPQIKVGKGQFLMLALSCLGDGHFLAVSSDSLSMCCVPTGHWEVNLPFPQAHCSKQHG